MAGDLAGHDSDLIEIGRLPMRSKSAQQVFTGLRFIMDFLNCREGPGITGDIFWLGRVDPDGVNWAEF